MHVEEKEQIYQPYIKDRPTQIYVFIFYLGKRFQVDTH